MVHLGQKLDSQHAGEEDCKQKHDHGAQQDAAPVFQHPAQPSLVVHAKPVDEPPVGDSGEFAVHVLLAENGGRHHRHQGQADEKRSEKRKRNGQGQTTRHLAGDAADENHREENGDGRQRGRGDGHAHFAGTDLGRFEAVLALLQMAEGVLDHHHGVVDEHPYPQREATQGHQVQGVACAVQSDERGNDRQRNGQADDQRRAPVAQEQVDHQHGQQAADQRVAAGSVGDPLDHLRNVPGQVELDVSGQSRLDFRQTFFHSTGHVHRVRSRALTDHHEHAFAPLHPCTLAHFFVRVLHARDVSQVNGRTGFAHADDCRPDLVQRAELAHCPHAEFPVTVHQVAARQRQVGSAKRVHHVRQG